MDANIEIQKISGLLADEERFKILGAIALGARTLDKIASVTGLGNAVIMKAIVKLEGAGLITKKENGYVFNIDVIKAFNRELSKNIPKKPALTDVERFLRDGKLNTYPRARSDQQEVFERFIELFEYERPYPEKEVNEKLKAVNPDFAALRRNLFDFGFFSRERVTEKDGHTTTNYWRVRHI